MTLRIGPSNYKVVLVNLPEETSGEFSKETKTIKIRRGSKHTLSTAFHEVFHAELYEASFECCDEWNGGIEEILVDILSRSVDRNYAKILAFLKKHKQHL